MTTNSIETKSAARQFVEFWRGKGYEKGQTQPFWIGLLKVLGVADPDQGFIEFEDKAHIDAAHGFIDGYIPATRVMVEQKSLGKNLRAAIPQSDGSLLTPFQQAKRYCLDLPLSRHPRWIVTCNFAEFDIYDMEKPNAEPERLLLDNLPDELYRLHFLVDTGSDTIRREEEISKKAGDVVGLIYDALLKQYEKCENVKMLPITNTNTQLETGNNGTGNTSTLAHSAMLASLNELCVRLVFLLYAEDADVFTHLQFHDYLKQFPASKARRALIDLFRVLDTPPDKRDPYLEADLAAFPYVNGGLFANENIEIPQFTDEILDLVLRKGSEDFDWKDISPTIFGAVFESTLNPETRRSGGMHYTSVANIHKVIDPLFLDALTERVEALCKCENVANNQSQHPIGTGNIGTGNTSTLAHSLSPRQRRDALLALQSELASITFLDPACGSGNFLTETYISLRRLENRILAALVGPQGVLDFDSSILHSTFSTLHSRLVRVSLSQFRGIEINDFAVKVAKTALWIAENQMLRETEAIAHRNLDFLPLKNYDGIIEGNALRLDWPRSDYIIGNPPFIGASMMTAVQKAEAVAIFGKGRRVNSIDYVGAWYCRAAQLMQGTNSRAAFVSTNSITQGEQVAPLWRPLVEQYGISIDFAHRTFRWDSESNSKAHVHCVIVGFHSGGAGGPPAKSQT
ncbi:MAG: class I SAM-dependent DNA methyltransferase, partial [Kiritimatiellae bacterium]|nr:class I SAM-dependent DNA methyltransferase [Kiritimatiellia bacterium]